MISFRMLEGHHLSVMEAQTTDELQRQILTFANSLGFKTFTAFAVVDQSPEKSKFYGIDNTPVGYAETYHDERLSRVDPVMQHCKRKSFPIIWNQDVYIESGVGEMWEHQAHYGYKTGIALGLHLPNGQHFSMGVDSDRPIPSNTRTLTRIAAELQLFAVHAQEAAFRILVPVVPTPTDRPELTRRELEVLKLTMDGMAASEISDVLNISERTTVFHLQNAMHKLNCNSKYQAVLKAIRLGFLS